MADRETGNTLLPDPPVWQCFGLIAALVLAYVMAVNWAASGVDPFGLVEIQAIVLGWRALAAVIVLLGVVLAATVAGLPLLQRGAFGRVAWWKSGTLFGLMVYICVFGLLALAFGRPFPDPDRLRTALGMFPCVVLVGWPLALAARGRLFRRRPRSS